MKREELRQLLRDAKLSQAKSARIMGYNPRQVSRWLRGEAEIPQAVGIVLMFFGLIEKLRDSGRKK